MDGTFSRFMYVLYSVLFSTVLVELLVLYSNINNAPLVGWIVHRRCYYARTREKN